MRPSKNQISLHSLILILNRRSMCCPGYNISSGRKIKLIRRGTRRLIWIFTELTHQLVHYAWYSRTFGVLLRRHLINVKLGLVSISCGAVCLVCVCDISWSYSLVLYIIGRRKAPKRLWSLLPSSYTCNTSTANRLKCSSWYLSRMQN